MYLGHGHLKFSDFAGSTVPPAPAGKGGPWNPGIRISNPQANPGQDSKVSGTQSKAKTTRQR